MQELKGPTQRTSEPESSTRRKLRGGCGDCGISQAAPHTLFMDSQPVLDPITCTVLMEPRTAASCIYASNSEHDTKRVLDALMLPAVERNTMEGNGKQHRAHAPGLTVI